MQRFFFIAIGGSFGSVLRYLVQANVSRRFGSVLSWGTLAVNLTACFLIGLLLETLDHRVAIHPAWRYLVCTGFIGAYSTFSGFEWDTWTYITQAEFWRGLLYVMVSLSAGLSFVALGASLARMER